MIVLLVGCFLRNDLEILKNAQISKLDTENITSIIPFSSLLGSMTFYFLLGGFLHKNLEKLKQVPILILAILFATGDLWLYVEWLISSKTLGSTWDSVFNGYTVLPTMLMAVSMYLICIKVDNSIFLQHTCFLRGCTFIGNNTLNVYYLHWILGFAFYGIIVEIGIWNNGIFVNLLKSILMILVCSYLGEILKKIPIINKLLH